jgi:hypothetical protein
MARFAFRGRAEQSRDFGVTFNVGLVCEVQITAVCLRFAGKGGFQVVMGMGAS